jgi:hypothetical protein
VATLAIVGALHHVDKDFSGWWLCEHQVTFGGLNERPKKLPDVKCMYLSTNGVMTNIKCQIGQVCHAHSITIWKDESWTGENLRNLEE